MYQQLVRSVWFRSILLGCLYFMLPNLRAAAQGNSFGWVTPCAPVTNVTGILESHRRAIATDAWGNTYVLGNFLGPIQIGGATLTTTGREKLFVAKLDPMGNYLWVTRISGDDEGSGGSDIALDQQGNAYVTGYVAGNDIRFGTQVLNNPGNGGFSDAFVAKISASGNWLWAARAGGADSDVGYGITVDDVGKVYVSGSFYSPVMRFGSLAVQNSTPNTFTADAFVAQLDAQGRWQWAVAAGGPGNDHTGAIAVDARDNLLVAGGFTNRATLGNQTIVSSIPFSTGFVASLSSAGRWKWALPLGQTTTTPVSDVAADTVRHEWVICGYSYGAPSVFGPSPISTTSNGNAFVARLDSAGAFRWTARPTGLAAASALAIDGLGNAHVLGLFNGPLQLGPTRLATQHPNPNWGDIFIARISAQGTWTWATSVGSPFDEATYGITLDRSDNIYLSGSSRGYVPNASAYFHPITFPLRNNVDEGFVAKLPATLALDDLLLCEGGQAELNGPAGASAYQWSTGATTPRITVRQPGIYSVAATVANGTVVQSTFRVRAYTPPAAQALGPDTTLCEGATLRLRAPYHGHLAATYRWSDGSANASLEIRQAGLYSVEVRHACGSYSLTRRVRYEPCGTLSASYIPNIITPNGDEANDLFIVPGLTRQPVKWALTVYNRWGSTVFETDAYQNNWGDNAPAGVYYYLLREHSTDRVVKGWVEVVR